MHGDFGQFAILLLVLSAAAALSLSVRLPVVPLYIIAGLVLRATGLVTPSDEVEFLGSLGVVFLLFSMGLEFSVGSVARKPFRFVGAGLCDFGLNFPMGLLAGAVLGWSLVESLLLAGILYMSSSAVVAKCIADFGRAARPETETVLGVMVFEDLVIAGYLVVLNAVMIGADAPSALWRLLLATAFVGLLFVLARHYQATLTRLLASRSEEAFTLTLFAFVLLVSGAAGAFLSEAIGAFLAGLVLGSTTLKTRAAETLLPFQTVFAALFFVSFGMSLDLAQMGNVMLTAILLAVLGFATKLIGGFFAGRIAGHSKRQAIVVGISLVPKGEFSVVIAGLAATQLGAGSEIVALTGLYVLILSILGPIAMREADTLRDLIFPIRPAKAKKEPSESEAA